MRIQITVLLFVLTLFPGLALAGQDEDHSVDPQVRVLFHLQSLEGDSRLAGWWVLPDVTAKGNTFRSLVVGGGTVKRETRWAEFMGGVLLHQNQEPEGGFSVDPVFNIRFSDRTFRRLIFFADLQHYFRDQRFYAWFSAETPIRIGSYEFRVGVESENILFREEEKQDRYGLGPRLALPLIVEDDRLTVIVAYQFRNDRDFLRSYVVFGF